MSTLNGNFIDFIEFIELMILFLRRSWGALMFTASMAGGISHFIMSDRKKRATNHCAGYVISTVFAFLSFFALLPSFIMNLSLWAS
jgi:hypothetical protein